MHVDFIQKLLKKQRKLHLRSQNTVWWRLRRAKNNKNDKTRLWKVDFQLKSVLKTAFMYFGKTLTL